MEKSKFLIAVNKAVDEIVQPLEEYRLYRAVKPIVNLARPELDIMIMENPAEVAEWIKNLHDLSKEILKVYEAEKLENDKMQVRQ